MGTDISWRIERKDAEGKWQKVDDAGIDFGWRSYGYFAFLGCDGRNYSKVTPVPGIEDISGENPVDADWNPYDGPSGELFKAISIKALLDFDYEQMMEDRRCMINGDGGSTCAPGDGEKMTYREFLGDGFLDAIKAMAAAGAERLVYDFD